MHSYFVEFRIISESEDFDIKSITEDLDIIPTSTRKRGDAKSEFQRFSESMWGYEVCPGKQWEDLGDGIESILKVLMPLKKKIKGYSIRYTVTLWCGHFASSFDGGPTLSPLILKKLSEFGVELFIDTYCISEAR